MSHKSKKNSQGPATPASPIGSKPLAAKPAASPAQAAAVVRDDFEPDADTSVMPGWLFVLMIALVYWAMVYLDHYGGGFNDMVFGPYESYRQLADLQPKSGPEMLIAQGATLFSTYCIACHQATGLGNPGQAPPLVGSPWVLGTPNRLIRIPNNGLTGPIDVKGQVWNLTMTPFAATLTDEELASILSFIRNNWGNSAPPVTPQQVKAVRDEIGSRARDGSASWTSDELKKIAE